MKPSYLGIDVTLVKKKRWNLESFSYYTNFSASLLLSSCIAFNVAGFIQLGSKPWWGILSIIPMVLVLYMNIRDFLQGFRKRQAMKKDGISYCNECNGRGLVEYREVDQTIRPGSTFKERFISKKRYFDRCGKCSGTGKVDWVRRVMNEEE
jgi:hypothetical protein